MKLPQAFFLQKLLERLRALNPRVKRLLLLSTVALACFLLVLPVVRHTAPQVNNEALVSIGNNVSQVAVQSLVVPESVEDATKEPAESAPKTQPALSAKDFTSPVSGKELRGTSKQVIWWPILEDYRLHPGADIQAPEGAKVIAAAAGTVSELGEDPVYGKALVLDHGNGWVSVYGQLQNLKVQLNSKVTQGQQLAQVGKPAGGEADMESHLHYELRHDQKVLNGGNPAE